MVMKVETITKKLVSHTELNMAYDRSKDLPYDDFWISSRPEPQLLREAANAIDDIFNWNASAEGNDFWMDVSGRLRAIAAKK